jgi:peptidoglycan/LPS O-acetylase OafA/YrhL
MKLHFNPSFNRRDLGTNRHLFHYKFFGSYRLLLAIVVVIGHLQSNFAPLAIQEALIPLGLGNVGVTSFFMLSGYVITEALELFYVGRLKEFLLNRFLRIMPPFILALLFSYAVHYLCYLSKLPIYEFVNSEAWLKSLEPLEVLANFFSVFDFRIPAAYENYHLYVRYIWAVVAEVQFYIVAGIMFSMALGFGRRKIFVGYVFVTAMIYLLSLVVKFPPALKLIEFFPYFLTGVCLYYVNLEVKKNIIGIIHVCTALSILLSFLCFARYSKFNLCALLLFGFSVFVFVILSRLRLTAKPFFRRIDSFLGDLSYPVYLNHGSIEVILYGFFQGLSMLIVWLGVASSLIMSFFLSMITEPFTRKLRNKIRGQVLTR